MVNFDRFALVLDEFALIFDGFALIFDDAAADAVVAYVKYR